MYPMLHSNVKNIELVTKDENNINNYHIETILVNIFLPCFERADRYIDILMLKT